MSDAINRCSAEETAACCCVDVGTVMDNTIGQHPTAVCLLAVMKQKRC